MSSAGHQLNSRCEACILAGGLSSRMGRDKSRARIAGRSLASHARAAAAELGLKARVIRRDLLPRSGPLGGIYTALATSRAELVLVLACDMPFVSAVLLREMRGALKASDRAVFAVGEMGAGFPCWLRRAACLPVVERQLKQGELSLQELARALRGRRFQPARELAEGLRNINTPAELAAARIGLKTAVSA